VADAKVRRSAASVALSACMCVRIRALKRIRLELSTPNFVHMHSLWQDFGMH